MTSLELAEHFHRNDSGHSFEQCRRAVSDALIKLTAGRAHTDEQAATIVRGMSLKELFAFVGGGWGVVEPPKSPAPGQVPRSGR